MSTRCQVRETPSATCKHCGHKIWLQRGTNKFVTHGPGKKGSFTCKGSGLEAKWIKIKS